MSRERAHHLTLRRTAGACSLAILLLVCARAPRLRADADLAGHGRVLIAHDHTLAVRDLASGAEQTLLQVQPSQFVRSPVWLPGGRGIIYVVQLVYLGDRNADWGSDIWIADARGQNGRVLLAHDAKGADVDGLTVTADGSALLYGYTRTDVDANGVLLGQVIQVRRLNAVSGEVSVVVDQAVDPAISPDGTQIVYLNVAHADDDSFGLWLSAADGNGARPLITVKDGFLAFFSPRFAPDGRTLLFSAAPDAQPASYASLATTNLDVRRDGPPQDIFTVALDGAGLSRLTHIAEDQPSAAWSADGTEVVVQGSTGCYILNADGTSLTRLGNGYLHGMLSWLDQ